MLIRFAAVTLAATALIAPASAGLLSDATYSASVALPVHSTTSPGTVSITNGSATVTSGGHAEVSGYVTNSLRFVGAGASVGYDFEFFGPAGSIDVDAAVRLYSQSNQDNMITSAWFMLQNAGSENLFVLGNPFDSANIDISQTVHLVLSANTPYHVVTGTSLHGSRIHEIDASGLAYADSRIYLSPSFQGDAGAYTLELSPGITFDNGNTGSDTPEPASAAMLVSGVAAIGIIRKRRR